MMVSNLYQMSCLSFKSDMLFGKPWKHFEENRSRPLFGKATKSISVFFCGGENPLKSLLKKKRVILSYNCSQLFTERCTRYRTCTCMARVCGIHILNNNNILHPGKLTFSLKRDHPQRNFHLRITDVQGRTVSFREVILIYIYMYMDFDSAPKQFLGEGSC